MALVSGLIGGAGGNIGSASVALVLNTSQFDAALARSQGKLTGAAAKMDAVGRRMSTVGGALTRGVTVPLAIAGGAATKMALDFNQAFVRIQTLGGKTGQSMDSLKAQVLELAEATGQDPGGLANALYIVSSAGKDAAANAMPILTQAAKGAALGMGDVETVTKVLTATTNAYGAENLSAAQSMDILSQAVTDSSAEADELAAALGPVIGVAAQVGVSFEQVAAALATATVQGVPTERAATGLRFLLQRLGAETPEATASLKEYGISLGELDRMLAQDGLQATLQKVAEEFDLTTTAGRQAWDQVVGGARGASVANTMVGDHAAAAAAEVENLGNVAGVTNEKFELWGQTITGKNAKALGALKAAAIRLGTDLIPIFQKLVGVVSKVVDAYNNLSPAAQDAVVKFALLAAAAGPLLRIFGPLVSLLARAGPAIAATGQAATSAAGGVGILSSSLVGIGGAGAATLGWIQKIRSGMVDLQDVMAFFGPGGGIGGFLSGGFEGLLAPLIDPAYKAKQANEALTQSLTPLVNKLNAMHGTLTPLEQAHLEAARAAGNQARATGVLNHAIDRTQKSIDQTNFKAWIDGILRGTRAEQMWARATANGNRMTAKQSQELARMVQVLADNNVKLNQNQQEALQSAVAYGRQKQAVDILNSAIKKLPDKKQIKVEAETAQAAAQIDQFIANMSGRVINLSVSTNGMPRGQGTFEGQHGLERTVTRPTMFIAGEAGMREHVSITPSGSGGARGIRDRPTFILNFNSPVMGSDVGAIVEKALTDRILKRGALV